MKKIINPCLSIVKDQSGMTLLEVMVGFVIFSSSLIAILDYVSNQLYLYQLASKNKEEIELLYNYSLLSGLGVDARAKFLSTESAYDLTYTSLPVEVTEDSKVDQVLIKTTLKIENGENPFLWAVYEFQ